MKSTISAIIIARNEQPRIATCLSALVWADEIIVIDNGSTDKTAEIAKKYNAKVIPAEGTDFSALRNVGLKEAKGEWVLYVDADEEITQPLKKEIEDIIASYADGQPVGYFIERDSYYLGHHWPKRDKMERLFLKRTLSGWRGQLHETPQVNGKICTIVNPLIHRTHRTLEEMVSKTNEWSEIEAHLRFRSHHPSIVWWRFLRVMVTGFWRSYIRDNGWRAGTVGWIESTYQGFSMFLTYAKLWELQQKKR